MEKYILQDDLKIFGVQVKTFPLGIGEAFDALVKAVSGKFDRDYYGISYMAAEGKIFYYAAAIEKQEGEAEKYNCGRYIIEKGEYLTSTIYDWRNKTDCIKDVLQELKQDRRVDKTKPCIEWYKNDDEMWCMIKMEALPK